VIEAEESSGRHVTSAPVLVQLDDHRGVITLRGERAVPIAADGPEAQDITVVTGRAIQVTDLQANSPDARFVRESVASRRHAVLTNRRRVAHGV
jgi:hypothetical protein